MHYPVWPHPRSRLPPGVSGHRSAAHAPKAWLYTIERENQRCTCPLKRDNLSRRLYIWTNHPFSGAKILNVSFQGGYLLKNCVIFSKKRKCCFHTETNVTWPKLMLPKIMATTIGLGRYHIYIYDNVIQNIIYTTIAHIPIHHVYQYICICITFHWMSFKMGDLPIFSCSTIRKSKSAAQLAFTAFRRCVTGNGNLRGSAKWVDYAVWLIHPEN